MKSIVPKKLTQALLCVALLSSIQVFSHSNVHPIRFVAPDGVDQGVCSTVSSRCKTINYAVNQSGKGDKVRVAAGHYDVDELDVFFLLSDMVEVTGSYTVQDNFAVNNLKSPTSTIVGLPTQYREKLATKGFHLLQDRKRMGKEVNSQDLFKSLNLYEKNTSKIQKNVACSDGMAGDYPCLNIDLLSQIPLNSLSSTPTSLSDIWGFQDLNDGKEYAIFGLKNGTAVVNVSDPSAPVEVGTITSVNSSWRDVKVYQYFDAAADRYKAYAYVTTEGVLGLEIIDLTNLPTSISLANTISTEFSKAHNVYISNIDYGTGLALENATPYLYILGSNTNVGAYRIYSLENPTEPELLITPSTGYIHDGTSMIITDSRTEQCKDGQNPCEIFVDYNETSVDLWDVTDKNSPLKISSSSYSNVSYTHSGWWSEDKMTLFIHDEGDEQSSGLNTTVHALDISNLASPTIVGTYTGETRAIDHNGFTVGGKYYMSNYRRGLVVLDVSNPSNMRDIGFFDTFIAPESNSANFNGAWGTYPFLPSGNILVSDIEYGLFVLKDNTPDADPDFDDTDTDNGNNDGDDDTPSSGSSSGGGSLNWLLLISLFMVIRLTRRHK